MTDLTPSTVPELDPYFNESQASIGIESFVKSIEANFAWFHNSIWEGDECKYLRLNEYRNWLRVYQPDYEYSEHLDAFWYACMKLDLLPLDTNCPIAVVAASEVIDARFDEVVMAITHYLYGQEFKRVKSDRKYQVRKNRYQAQEALYDLLGRYSRVLAIRTDFGYLKEYLPQIGIADADRHLKTFIKEINTRSEFKHMKLYARVIEQGKSRGYHIHFAAYFNGDDHWQGWYMANMFCKLWEEVSEGMGCSHNCNRDEAEYEANGSRGIGMLHRNNPQECRNAVIAIGYVANVEKVDQHLRVRMANQRSFAMSQLDKA